jgi:hypothetical protein
VWLDYLSLLLDMRVIALARRTFDRALAALPITQHERVWVLYLVRARVAQMQQQHAVFCCWLLTSTLGQQDAVFCCWLLTSTLGQQHAVFCCWLLTSTLGQQHLWRCRRHHASITHRVPPAFPSLPCVQRFLGQPGIPVETAVRCYRRYLQLCPGHTEEFVAYLKQQVSARTHAPMPVRLWDLGSGPGVTSYQ